jgi:hypothetical protein
MQPVSESRLVLHHVMRMELKQITLPSPKASLEAQPNCSGTI